MIKKCISKNWKFSNMGQAYVDVDLPHDYAITKERRPDAEGGKYNGFYPDSRGKYVKFLNLDRTKHYVLDIDGAYMCTQIFLNEHHLALHPYGYTPFLVDLTPYVMSDCTNKLAITTTPLYKSTRWYSGNGIYRDVFLWEGGDIRIEPWDMFISTLSVEDRKAKIRLKFTVSADREASIKIIFSVMSSSGSLVKTEKAYLKTVSEGKNLGEYIIEIDNPKIWDIESPNLYTLKTEIYENDDLIDESSNDFGIKTVEANVKDGLILNGKPVKLRGGCIHHDHGVLGAKAFPAAEARKIRLLKEAGFNAIRTAHNPPSLALLESCDKIGMIVMDEAFDVWNKPKCENDYHLFFNDWCLRDISYMVQRDRNHPCVLSYSIGNEIFEIDGTSGAAKYAAMLAEEIKKYDDTKFVTSGVQKFLMRKRPEDIDPDDYRDYLKVNFNSDDVRQVNKASAGYESALDIMGCNYYYDNYSIDHEMYPDRVMWGSENYVTSFYDSWKEVQEKSYVFGDFTWTAIDNMGEVGTGRSLWAREGTLRGFLAQYPWRNCYQGDLDLCGYRRPQSYFREAVWLRSKEPRIFVTHPEHFGEGFTGTNWHWYDVNESWTFDDKYIGRPIKAETYTDADKIEWYVNGKFVGQSVPEKAIATIETVYEKGEITAVAYKENKECGRYTVCTTGKACCINITAEQREFFADNRDLCYFDISVTDSSGRIVCDAQDKLECIVEGGELLGIFSGNPCNEDQFTSNSCHAFKGRALAIVRTNKSGNVIIKVYSENLASGYAQATAK